MEEAIEYVIKGGDDTVEITESGYLTNENCKLMKFEFGPTNDITESLAKKNTLTTKNISVTQKGRTAYAPGACIYPDGSKSSTIVVAEAYVQYREGVLRDNSKYGLEYVCIGISTGIIGKITSDARKNSSVILKGKKGTEVLEGLQWFSCSLSNLGEDGITIISGEGDTYNSFSVDLVNTFRDLRSTMKAIVSFTMSASQTTERMEEPLDLLNGKYVLTFKPTEIILLETSDKIGPVLEDTNRRGREKMAKTENSAASGKLAAYALKKLTISG